MTHYRKLTIDAACAKTVRCMGAITAIWNHEFLLQRVDEVWRPEMEG